MTGTVVATDRQAASEATSRVVLGIARKYPSTPAFCCQNDYRHKIKPVLLLVGIDNNTQFPARDLIEAFAVDLKFQDRGAILTTDCFAKQPVAEKSSELL